MLRGVAVPTAVAAGVLKEGVAMRFGFHNLRHSLASLLVRTNMDLKTVQLQWLSWDY